MMTHCAAPAAAGPPKAPALSVHGSDGCIAPARAAAPTSCRPAAAGGGGGGAAQEALDGAPLRRGRARVSLQRQ